MSGAGRHTIHALGTECSLLGYGVSPSAKATEIFTTLIQRMDATASRFRSDSEIQRVFDGKPRSGEVISPLLFEALEAALFGAEITQGYLDPTVACSLVAMGYEKDFLRVPAKVSGTARDVKVAFPAGFRNIRLNHSDHSVSISAGVNLDLGSTGKAFLADKIRETIESEISETVLVNLGGDISASAVADRAAWPIKITDDASLDASSKGIIIPIFGGGIATSSVTWRAWQISPEKTYHHIVDPHTGISANSPFASVTVLAGSALHANIASTGTIAMGEKGEEWLVSTGLPALARMRDASIKYFGPWDRTIVEEAPA